MEDLTRLLAETAGVDPGDVTHESTLHDLGIESREVPRLLQKLARRYQVTVGLAGLAHSRDVGDFYRLLASKTLATTLPEA